MPNICKDQCSKYNVVRRSKDGSMYARGFKKCSICCLFLSWDGVFCPCCGTRMATKPKNRMSKEAYEKHLTSMSMECKN